MADHTYEELRGMTVVQLREVARGIEHEAVRGYSQLRKDQLIPVICEALGLEMHAHHEVVGVNKSEIKAQIKALKTDRDTALEAHDHEGLKLVRRKIHRLKRKLHKATV